MPGSVDELGLGQIRDALGDGLFPGTSTLHTRARYLLFVPWTFMRVSARTRRFIDADNEERRLIEALKRADNTSSGMIGAIQGANVKSLPSTVYWSALATYKILQDRSFTRERAVELHGLPTPADPEEKIRAWREGIPEPPTTFPEEVQGGFNLERSEAEWLRERMIEADPSSLLAYLLDHPDELTERPPWDALGDLPGLNNQARALMEHASLFSDVIHGAQLLYNLEIARSCKDHEVTQHEHLVEHYTEKMGVWAEQLTPHSRIASWNLDDFFYRVTKIRESNIHPRLTGFVRDWVELVLNSEPRHLATNETAARLIRARERETKRGLARINNPSRLHHWGGASGSTRLEYRWPYVHRILLDLHEGLASDEPSALGASHA